MLDITVDSLAQESGVPASLILQIEATDGTHGIEGTDATPQTYAAIKSALERMGTMFLEAGEGGPGGQGVRAASKAAADDGMRPEELTAANDD
jgi:hypothetical protein